jgi:hypothetical protein
LVFGVAAVSGGRVSEVERSEAEWRKRRIKEGRERKREGKGWRGG